MECDPDLDDIAIRVFPDAALSLTLRIHQIELLRIYDSPLALGTRSC